MQQIQQNIMMKLSTEEIEYLIKNPLQPPINFMDKIIPMTKKEIKNLPHPPKEWLEDIDKTNDELINEAEDKIINCYFSWREQDLDKDEEENKYCYDNFDIYCNQIELDDEEYDDNIIKIARERASKTFQRYHNESMAKINCIKKEMNIKKTFNKQNKKMQKYITKYLEEYQESNLIYQKKKKQVAIYGGVYYENDTDVEFLAHWDSCAKGYSKKEDYRNFIKCDIIKKLY
tara:strand:- start:94 stop:786 length:693 start_codon:yes stop_codon:yes gene_type:complete